MKPDANAALNSPRRNVGTYLSRRGHLAQRAESQRTALEGYTHLGDTAGMAITRFSLSSAYDLQQCHTLALEHAHEALRLCREAGDCLARAHHKLGRHAESAQCYRDSLALFSEPGSPYLEATTLDHPGAFDARTRALEILEPLARPDTVEIESKLLNTSARR